MIPNIPTVYNIAKQKLLQDTKTWDLKYNMHSICQRLAIDKVNICEFLKNLLRNEETSQWWVESLSFITMTNHLTGSLLIHVIHFVKKNTHIKKWFFFSFSYFFQSNFLLRCNQFASLYLSGYRRDIVPEHTEKIFFLTRNLFSVINSNIIWIHFYVTAKVTLPFILKQDE